MILLSAVSHAALPLETTDPNDHETMSQLNFSSLKVVTTTEFVTTEKLGHLPTVLRNKVFVSVVRMDLG